MHAWRLWIAVVAFSFTGRLQAQTVSLSEAPLPDACFKVELQMKLEGTMSFVQRGKTVSLPQTADASFAFNERILSASQNLPERAFRIYQNGKAVIAVDKNKLERTLHPDRLEMIAQRYRDRPYAYSRWAHLTREEVELTEHFDTLSIPGLVPFKDLGVGETWKVNNLAVQCLAHLEGITGHDLVCKLERVQGNIAHFSVQGEIQGIDLGASVKSTIQAHGEFDVQSKRVVALEWNNKEVRGQGPVNPALEATIKVTVKRTQISQPRELDTTALAGLLAGAEPPESKRLVQFVDAGKHYHMLQARDWILVNETPKATAFRLMEQGDFVAQVTLVPIAKGAKSMMAFGDFETIIQKTPGWEPTSSIGKDQNLTLANNQKGYRIGAAGKLEGVEVVMYFYLIGNSTGDQMLATFAMSPNQVQKLASRDFDFVQKIALGAK